jgi:hydroxypyruvate isomerase
MTDGYGFELAVCAEMVFPDEPFERRVHIIHDLGFSVEIWTLLRSLRLAPDSLR